MSRPFAICVTLAFMLLTTLGCDVPAEATDDASAQAQTDKTAASPNDKVSASKQQEASTEKDKEMPELETITFGAGCFWCIEAVLDRIEGVEEVTSGYMGGQTLNPTYQQICTGLTGHAEVVEVKFNPETLPLEKLLDIFFQLHDPTQLNRQGPDIGTQYRSAIFYSTKEQKEAAEKSKEKWNETRQYRGKIVTEIAEASVFYPAEVYHQDYFAKNPEDRYCRSNILPKFKKLGLLKKSDR